MVNGNKTDLFLSWILLKYCSLDAQQQSVSQYGWDLGLNYFIQHASVSKVEQYFDNGHISAHHQWSHYCLLKVVTLLAANSRFHNGQISGLQFLVRSVALQSGRIKWHLSKGNMNKWIVKFSPKIWFCWKFNLSILNKNVHPGGFWFKQVSFGLWQFILQLLQIQKI